jgi:hypothetical protein
MPDTTIPFDTLSNQSADEAGEPLLNGAQMRELLAVYVQAQDAYKSENGYVQERDEERVSAAYNEAMDNVLYAPTIDPEGIAIKLKVLGERGDMPEGFLQEVFEELTHPRPAPSMAELAKSLAEAARPHVEEGGNIISRANLVDALAPLIGHFTVADAVCAIGFLRTAGAVFSEDGCDDALFAVTSILEDFASLGDAADEDSAAARAYLIQMAADDDSWGLGDYNMTAATRHAAADMRHMRKGDFDRNIFGSTFVSKIQFPGWLMQSIESNEGSEAGRDYAESVHAARRVSEPEQLAAAE